MHSVSVQDILQTLSLLVLAGTVAVSLCQLKAATDQAKSSANMAQYSLQQTEVMHAHIHQSFRPVVGVLKGLYGPTRAVLTLSNFGAGAALNVVGIHRSGYRLSIGPLQVGQTIEFQFDNRHNSIPCLLGADGLERLAEMNRSNPYPLRLEYQSVTGANCWTTIAFPLGHEGDFMPETAFGIELPFQASVNLAALASARS